MIDPFPMAARGGAGGRWTGQAGRSGRWRRHWGGREGCALGDSASVAHRGHRSRYPRRGVSYVISGEGRVEGSLEARAIVVGHRSSQPKPVARPDRHEAGGVGRCPRV